jgi:PAS domain S-box-containing protein
VNLVQWIGSGITRRITASAVLLTMAIVAGLGAISYTTMRSQIREAGDAGLREDAERLALRIERLLDAISENVAGIAANYIMSNGLQDPEGRGRYLGPFFLSYRLPEQISFTLALCDRKGAVIAGNAQLSSYRSFRDSALLKQVIRNGSPYASMLPDRQQNITRAAYPVRATASTKTRGMLVLEISLDEIFERAWHTENARGTMNASLQYRGGTIWEQRTFETMTAATYSRSLHHLRPPFDGLKLAIMVSEPADMMDRSLKILTLTYLAAGLVILLMTLVLTRLLAGRLTGPLVSLTEAADRVAGGGSLAVTIVPQGQDEVGSLARAFNTMLARLRAASEKLEQRVEERTQELEMANRDLTAEKTFSDSAIDSLPGIFYVLDESGSIVRRNRNLALITGYADDELSRMTAIDFVPPEERDRLADAIQKAFDGGYAAIETALLTRTGDSIPFYLTGSSATIADRTMIIGMGIDIAARKRAEEKLKESEEKFRSLIESTSDWIWEIDVNGVYTYSSPKVTDILGYEPEEIMGKTPFDLMPPEEAARLAPRFASITRERGLIQRLENRNVHKTGRPVVLETSGVPVFDKYGQWRGYRGIDRDITERKLAEKTLEELNRTLQRRVEEEVAKNREKDRIMMVQSRQAAMGEMLGNIAHQWRQPLNIVGLIIQDIQDAQLHGQLTPAYLDKSVQRGMEVIQHMSQTIDDFRGFYRTDKGKRTFILNEVIDKVRSFIEASFRNMNITLDVRLESAIEAEGYPNEFSQVLLNILNNARDVLLERKVRSPKITVRLSRQDGRAVVTIGDNGGGIAGDHQERLFEPFFTTKEEGKGTGIGLYMSKNIVEKNMSGRLTARNTAEGAEFRIEL